MHDIAPSRCIDDSDVMEKTIPCYCIFSLILDFVCLIRFFTSHQQSFRHIGTGLPGLNQY